MRHEAATGMQPGARWQGGSADLADRKFRECFGRIAEGRIRAGSRSVADKNAGRKTAGRKASGVGANERSEVRFVSSQVREKSGGHDACPERRRRISPVYAHLQHCRWSSGGGNQNPPHPLLTERVIHESTARRPYQPALLDGSSCDIHCRCPRCYGSAESHANSHVQSHAKLRGGGACWSRRRRWW